MEFIEIRCPNRVTDIYVCFAELAGPSLNAVRNHNYSSGAFVDLRYCAKCNVFIKVTIESLNAIPVCDIIHTGTVIPFKKIDKVLGVIEVRGRKSKYARDNK